MARDVSIAITARDNFSQAITTMRNANQSFNKDLTGLQTKLDALNRTKATLKVDADKAKKELKEVEKLHIALGGASEETAKKLETANESYENARRNLSLVSDQARATEKDIRNMTDAVSRADNRAGGGAMGSLGKTLAASGASAYFGKLLSGAANTFVGSAFGSEVGTLFGSSLSGAGIGAAIGSAIAPGIGTAIGAALGVLTGLIDGAVKNFEKEDDAFKEYYRNQYETITQAQEAALTSGSGIAAYREQLGISFSTLLGGEENASQYLKEMTAFAARTPFEYEGLASISRTLLAYGYQQDELLPLLEAVGDAGSALGMSSEDMKYVATGLGRMQSTGKTTLEYLNPLLERGVPVWEYLAEASGKTREEVQEMVSKGLVPGEEAAKAIAEYMGADFAGNMERQAKTFDGLASTLQDGTNELNNAMGEGYNMLRKTGMQEQIDWLSGESGTEMKDAYNKIGQWKASLENLKEEYQRDAITAVMTGDISAMFSPEMQGRLTEMYQEYASLAASGAEDAGAQMGALLAEAQAIAQNEYNASEGMQIQKETELALVDSLRADAAINDAYWRFGYDMEIAFSKGRAAAAFSTYLAPSTGDEWLDRAIAEAGPAISARTHAYGLSYVPYDNYPALLHQGEEILTASEARSSRGGHPITISGNNFTVREEADIYRIAQELVRQFNQAILLSE
jgi:tape measure domain-containing protein